MHAVLEALFDLPAPERTPDAAVALVPGRWAAMLAERPELATLVGTDDGPDEQAWYAQAEALVHRWFTLEDPTRLEPHERESRVEVEVDGLRLRGIIDRLDVAPTGEVRVVDYKTGRSPSERFEGRALFQMRFYALIIWRSTGRVPDLLQLVYLRDAQVIRYSPDEADLLALERNVRAVSAAIQRAHESGDWRPSPSRLCSWCDFRALCPAFGGTPPPLPPRDGATAGSGDLVLDAVDL